MASNSASFTAARSQFKTPAAPSLIHETEAKNWDPRTEDLRGGSLLTVRRNQFWQDNMQELSPDSREIFDDLEEAVQEHSSYNSGAMHNNNHSNNSNRYNYSHGYSSDRAAPIHFGLGAMSGASAGMDSEASSRNGDRFSRASDHVPFHLSTPGFHTPSVQHTPTMLPVAPAIDLTSAMSAAVDDDDDDVQRVNSFQQRRQHASPTELVWTTQERPRPQRNHAARSTSLRLSFSRAMSPAASSTPMQEMRAVEYNELDMTNEIIVVDNDEDEEDVNEDVQLISQGTTQQGGNQQAEEAKTAEELMDESERLARQLMAEEENEFLERLHQAQLEAMQGFQRSRTRSVNSEARSDGGVRASEAAEGEDDEEEEEDQDVALALRLMAEEQEQAQQAADTASSEVDIDPDEMSYDQLVELGERIGNVKQERWRVDGRQLVEALPVVNFTAEEIESGGLRGVDTTKCLVCQYSYEEGEELKIMPCKHAFHKECIDPWLEDHDTCVACKQSLRDISNP